ncbi:hypothetical protein K435DRAFT_778020 [Dendrothele bispora CBS 962.96]|uniref:Uncharacterized protein n=1 Tax=Dendrothele bispora (strain CBS 962.96) TaxID=1314807 RepID=A0A4S8M668_DENBC|nr:hypothetical protein K435DRAFT_778020 [Dendrothele bispora CBS 962.96]
MATNTEILFVTTLVYGIYTGVKKKNDYTFLFMNMYTEIAARGNESIVVVKCEDKRCGSDEAKMD